VPTLGGVPVAAEWGAPSHNGGKPIVGEKTHSRKVGYHG
jgi:hypothetical protein